MVVAPDGIKPVGRTLYDVWSVNYSEFISTAYKGYRNTGSLFCFLSLVEFLKINI